MANELFYYEVEHFYKRWSRHGPVTMQFPRDEEKLSISQMVRTIKRQIPIGSGRAMGTTIFL